MMLNFASTRSAGIIRNSSGVARRSTCLNQIFRQHPTLYFLKCTSSLYTSKKDDKLGQSEAKSLGSSTIFLQDGLNIKELPIMVQRVNYGVGNNGASITYPTDENKDFLPGDVSNLGSTDNVMDKPTSTAFDDEGREAAAVQEGLARCKSLFEMFTLLEMIPAEEVTPQIATFALGCIGALQNNNSTYDRIPSSDPNAMDTFAWAAIIDRLVKTVRQSTTAFQMLLEGLRAVGTCTQMSSGSLHVDSLVQECLVRVAEGRVTVEETCELVHILSVNPNFRKEVDKLWPVFMNQQEGINERNLAKVYEILPLLKKSRTVVLGVLHRRTIACFWTMKNTAVTSVLSTLVSIDYTNLQLLSLLTKWVHLNIHTLSESDLLTIVDCFQRLRHMDSIIVRIIERYTKTRHSNIKSADLVVTISKFCVQSRLSSSITLDAVGKWFEEHHAGLKPHQIFHIVRSFGILNHVPSNTVKFFSCIENAVEKNFFYFNPDELVEMLLSCTYLHRYPLNFVQKLFNPFYLDRLNTIKDEVQLLKARCMFQQLDMAMFFGCPLYDGPMLHKDRSSVSLMKENRIIKMQSMWLDDAVAKVLGGYNKFVKNNYIPSLPLVDIYICDYLFTVDHNNKALPFAETHGIFKRKAVIIRLPEHYTSDKMRLMGRYMAQVEHITKLGYDVVELDYAVLQDLQKKPPLKLKYLRSKLLKFIEME